jgi:Pentapeptide repeats (8 copies)
VCKRYAESAWQRSITHNTRWCLYFTYQQNQTSLNVSKSQHDTDTQIAQDQQHEALLEGYLDHMSDLLLNGHLRDSKPRDEIRDVARARTLETLFRLDPGRREAVLGFLYEAGLIGVSIERAEGGQKIYNPIPTIVYLDGADLNKATLDGHILVKADLSNTYLSEANMTRAALLTTNLHGAILENTNLAGAKLNDADLSDASLEGAMMNIQTDLSGIILQGAKYNTKPIQVKDAQGNPLTLEPTQWPQGFDPKAAGAICIDC